MTGCRSCDVMKILQPITDEELIEELKDRGYKVTKTEETESGD